MTASRSQAADGTAGVRPWGIAAAIALAVSHPTLAFAFSGGVTGVSGRQGSTCTACHFGGAVPAVAIEGPERLAPGETAAFRFVVTSNGASQVAAGFNVAASNGILVVVAPDSQKSGAELTHTRPQANVEGRATWDFAWQAPEVPGSYRLFAAGNSVNLNGSTDGDNARATFRDIDVSAPASTPTPSPSPAPASTPTPSPSPAPATPTATSTVARMDTPTPSPTRTSTPSPTPTATPVPPPMGPGDANCDERINAADPSAAILRLAAGTVGNCDRADADCDDGIDAADVDIAARRIFAAPSPPACASAL